LPIIQTIKDQGKINMEILLGLVIILIQFLVIRGAVHQGTFDALIEFEEYNNKKEKNKTN